MSVRAHVGRYTVHCDGQATTQAWHVTDSVVEEVVERFHTYGEALAHALHLNKTTR